MLMGLAVCEGSSASSKRIELNMEANDRSSSSSRIRSASSTGLSSSGGASRPSYSTELQSGFVVCGPAALIEHGLDVSLARAYYEGCCHILTTDLQCSFKIASRPQASKK